MVLAATGAKGMPLVVEISVAFSILDTETAEAVVARTAASMGRRMQADDVLEGLLRNLDHPRWQDVPERCLTCGNCTMVCPTCSCTSVEDTSDLGGTDFSRSRRWDSCFTMDFSHINGAA